MNTSNIAFEFWDIVFSSLNNFNESFVVAKSNCVKSFKEVMAI